VLCIVHPSTQHPDGIFWDNKQLQCRDQTVCLLHFERRTTPSARSSATWRRTCSVVSWNSELTPTTGAVVTSIVTWIWRRI